MVDPLQIVATIALAAAQGDVQPDVSLAWDGHVTTGSLTELTISASSGADSQVTVQSVQTSPVSSVRLDVRQGSDALVSMPTAFEPGRPASIRYRVDNGAWQFLEAGRIDKRPRNAVVAGEAAAEWLADLDRVMIVAATELPRAASTYSHISAIGIDRKALSRLDEAQLRAILEYAGVCGRVLLVDPPSRVAELMEQRAGCGGRNFATSVTRQDTRTALAALAGQSPNNLPDERLLASLIADRGADTRLMALFLAGFLLIFLLLTRIRRPQGTHLAFSVLATLAAGILWAGGSRQSFVAWAEAATTDRVARYASLERATAQGRGQRELRMQSLERSPMRIGGADLVLHWSAVGSERRFDWTAPVLQEAQVYATGSFPVDANLRAAEAEGKVTLCNLGGSPSQPSFLRWGETNYSIPVLAPGARWQLDGTEHAAADTPELRVLARRASGYRLTLLQPLAVPANGGAGQAWLMRRETAEASPCIA